MKRINFELDELQAFAAVAEKQSFRAAVESLYLSLAALSRRISMVELDPAPRQAPAGRCGARPIGREVERIGCRPKSLVPLTSTRPCSTLTWVWRRSASLSTLR